MKYSEIQSSSCHNCVICLQVETSNLDLAADHYVNSFIEQTLVSWEPFAILTLLFINSLPSGICQVLTFLFQIVAVSSRKNLVLCIQIPASRVFRIVITLFWCTKFTILFNLTYKKAFKVIPWLQTTFSCMWVSFFLFQH